MTDGSVMVFNFSFPNLGQVWKLVPDAFGSYVNGTWKQLASFPYGYAPYAFASAVLPDGRVIVEGGEYNGPTYELKWTDLGAIYDPVTDTWTRVTPPPFFNGSIGDAQSVVLPNGTFMVANALSKQAALLDAKTLTWTETGTSTKWDVMDEEGWVLLPNGKVLTIDANGINVPSTVITTDQEGVGPFLGISASGPFTNNVAPQEPIVGPAAVATPDNDACTPVDDLTGKIGICFRGPRCASGTIVPNMAAANAIAVIEISEVGVPSQTGGANGVPFSCMISTSDGEALVAALETYPEMVVTITQPPATIIENYSELYCAKTGTWGTGGTTIVPLADPVFDELGPMILRPDGTVFCAGSVQGNSAIYNSRKGTWAVGPKFPSIVEEGQLGCADAPGALLPNGNVLVAAGVEFNAPMHIFEFDGYNLIEQPTVSSAAFLGADFFNMLVLPTGQIMMTDGFTTDVEIYTPGNRSYKAEWAPVVHKAPESVRAGKTYKIQGVRFNGMSQAQGFGDEDQAATNYPLVRITNNKTGHVFYCRTHDHSYMGVASKKKVHTCFDVPYNIESGKSTLEVVANGIPSKPVHIHVK